MLTRKYLMWAFQPHFQLNADLMFRGLCETLGCDLGHRVFLVGFLNGEHTGFLPVCTEPEEEPYHPDLFAGIHSRPLVEPKIPAGRVVMHPEDWNAWFYQRQDYLASVGSAVLRVIGEQPGSSRYLTRATFVREVGRYLVTLVLQVDRAAYERWPHLHRHEVDGLRVHTSLLDALIHHYLEYQAGELSKPNPGQMGRDRSADELIREAGKSFMYKVSTAGANFHGLHGLFEVCNTISSLKYEGAEGLGSLVVARKDHPALSRALTFANPIDLRDYRAARKVLELSGGRQALLCDAHTVYGIGEVSPEYDPAGEDLFVVRFIRQHEWEVRHGPVTLMRVAFGDPSLPRPRFNRTRFEEIAGRVLSPSPPERLQRLAALAAAASGQARGTLLVISPDAVGEAVRLERQAIRVTPEPLTTELLALVTTIDGAVLLGPDGVCYAVGVILDGRATPKGSPSRGSRYNSAVRYVEQHPDCVALVVSEDGMIDILPDLRARVGRPAVVAAVAAIRSLATSAAPTREAYNDALKRLDELRFYLSAEECQQVNASRRQAEQKAVGDGGIVVYAEFVPNPEMNETYFLPAP